MFSNHNNDMSKHAAPSAADLFAAATGIRRMSMAKIQPNDAVRDASGLVTGIRVREKGTHHRTVPVLNMYREVITGIVDVAATWRGEDVPIFDSCPPCVSNWNYRREYAAALLLQLEEERKEGLPLFAGAFQLDDYCHLRGKDAKRRAKTQGHDTDLLGAVSGALGHNRIDVVLRHYLYLY